MCYQCYDGKKKKRKYISWARYHCLISPTDYCNNRGRIDHKCIACTTDNGNSNCLQDPTKIVQTRCPAPTTDEAYCFVTAVGNRTTRGCITSTRELQICSESSSNCNTCPVNATYPCNSYTFPTKRLKCKHCSGTNCTAVSSASLYCNYPDDSCVSVNNYGNQIQGCARNLGANDINFCNNHKRSCITCNSNDCNSAVPKSPADYNGLYEMAIMRKRCELNIFLYPFSLLQLWRYLMSTIHIVYEDNRLWEIRHMCDLVWKL